MRFRKRFTGTSTTAGFFWVNTPIITASDCEGAGDLFRVSTLDIANRPPGGYGDDFFGRETFLTVSGQLNVESYCLAMSKVYTFGPTFRAENSHTARHLAEFWMVEPEIAFANLDDNADLAADLLKTVLADVLERCGDDMTFFADRIDRTVVDRLQRVIDAPFERLSYSEAVDILRNSGESFEFPVEWGLDLQSEHERYLTERHVNGPVVVVDYPKEIKAFYMRLNDDGKTVAAMDVLLPGVGEIIGGSQREERIDVLDARMDAGAGKGPLVVPGPQALRNGAPRGFRARAREAAPLRVREWTTFATPSRFPGYPTTPRSDPNAVRAHRPGHRARVHGRRYRSAVRLVPARIRTGRRDVAVRRTLRRGHEVHGRGSAKALSARLNLPSVARRLARRNRRRIRDDWNTLRETYMTRGVYRKCRTSEDAASALLDTGERRIVETSQYDYYWGCGRDTRGLNTYGKVLMRVRGTASERKAPERKDALQSGS